MLGGLLIWVGWASYPTPCIPASRNHYLTVVEEECNG